MSVPDWWEAAILALGAWRIFHLLAYDDILDRPRNWVVGLEPGSTRRAEGNESLMDFLECPFCFGFWIALATWGAWEIWPHGTLVFMIPWMLSAGVVAAHKVLSSSE